MSSDFIYIYPPGIPIVTPGEILSRDIIRGIRRALEFGRSIKGVETEGPGKSYVYVVKEARNGWLPRRKKRI